MHVLSLGSESASYQQIKILKKSLTCVLINELLFSQLYFSSALYSSIRGLQISPLLLL